MTRRLVDVQVRDGARAAVVVMHGGASRPGQAVVSPAQLSVLRMIPVARRVARTGGRRLAVTRLLNSARGWDTDLTPVDDAVWAIQRLCDRLGDVPVALVGHSLGGRAALLAGADPAVRSVVALNPWVQPHDDADLSGRHVLVVHGTEDRVASPVRSRAMAERLSRRADVEFLDVPGGKHAMLSHGRTFERAAADFVAETLA
ncbi:MAG: alpha/beta hydrolase [Nocardioides sp.]|nr:alpha/beta hydrolase [Nocardioides sp.]